MISSLEYSWRFFRAWLAQKGSLLPCPRNEEEANDNVLDVADGWEYSQSLEFGSYAGQLGTGHGVK
jgi:hypothetical protein